MLRAFKASRRSLCALLLLALPYSVSAYSWHFDADPQQCTNFSISITGNDGVPPYRLLVLPVGPTPLANNIESRRIQTVPFQGDDTSVSFKLNYPANSQLVVVVSDSTAYGSGGTSVAATVQPSNDATCFDSTKSVSPDFFFNIDPPNQIVQCQSTRIWWDATQVQGDTTFLGIIPGGQSFVIPQSKLTNVSSQGTGFSWTPNLRGGTTLILVGGDARGNGTAGSSFNIVSSGINNDGSCLSQNSPSSTPGAPAGGSYPTSAVGSSGGSSSSGKKTNVGAIVGGVVGGVALLLMLLLLLLWFRRKSHVHKHQKEGPVDLLTAEEEGDDTFPRNQLPHYYQPEPFVVPDPTSTSEFSHSEGRPLSGTSTSFSGVPAGDMLSGTSNSRKNAPRVFRPVNIVQHDDAGAAGEDEAQGVETVELPPAYTMVGKNGARIKGAGAGAEGPLAADPSTGTAGSSSAPETIARVTEMSERPDQPTVSGATQPTSS